MAPLNGIGATQSVNGLGTRVLEPERIAEHCDSSEASVQKQLYSYAESVHVLTLSCRQVTRGRAGIDGFVNAGSLDPSVAGIRADGTA